MSIPARTRQEWQALDAQHNLHPFTTFKEIVDKGARIISRADGVYIYDVDGNRILDGMSGLWCVNIGYGREELVQAAARQMRELPFYNQFFQCSHPPAIELARQLTEITQPHINHVFFTGSGSESNDTVLRMVWRYWSVLGQPERRIVISRKNGYHGSTLGGASLGGFGVVHEQFFGPIPNIVHIGQPYWYGEGADQDPAAFGLARARELEAKILELGPDKVAAFIGEPVQGAGGVIVPPETYWPEIQRICDKYGILLITDEVICGFGRLGSWFGADHYGVKPDLMPIAKGLTSGYIPLGGVLVGDRVAGVLKRDDDEFFHGFTYSGHPVACAVAAENLRILREEKIVEHVRDTAAPYFAERLGELAEHPLVGEVRTRGLMGAIELVRNKATRERFPSEANAAMTCREHCFRNGLVMRAVAQSMIVAPPLVITRAEIDELIDKARRCLDLTARDLGVR